MADETWPIGIVPFHFQRNGYNETIQANKIRTSMEAGIDKVRRRYTNPVINFSGSIWMNLEEMNAFKDFYNINLGGGVERFNFPVPSSDTDPQETKETRIFGEPAYVNIGGRYWTVSLKMEQL